LVFNVGQLFQRRVAPDGFFCETKTSGETVVLFSQRSAIGIGAISRPKYPHCCRTGSSVAFRASGRSSSSRLICHFSAIPLSGFHLARSTLTLHGPATNASREIIYGATHRHSAPCLSPASVNDISRPTSNSSGTRGSTAHSGSPFPIQRKTLEPVAGRARHSSAILLCGHVGRLFRRSGYHSQKSIIDCCAV